MRRGGSEGSLATLEATHMGNHRRDASFDSEGSDYSPFETLRSDAALAESEAESLGNTLESQTHQLRSKDAENKALKAELAQIKAKAAAATAAMAEAIKQAVDAAVAKCVAEM